MTNFIIGIIFLSPFRRSAIYNGCQIFFAFRYQVSKPMLENFQTKKREYRRIDFNTFVTFPKMEKCFIKKRFILRKITKVNQLFENYIVSPCSIILHHKLRQAIGPCTKVHLAHDITFLIMSTWSKSNY
ncbi:hypothetical protein BpHYR1_027704 [Brachionus plicatilis]|uniref:Uncharacterized protein n=1 Tax=Brachionus plicatilis TaxID=10195 RepID=A0A3M7QY87_BRAPC|nr:hypothetical protein BpHYR1_027704 [Brachionus plicatilis]